MASAAGWKIKECGRGRGRGRRLDRGRAPSNHVNDRLERQSVGASHSETAHRPGSTVAKVDANDKRWKPPRTRGARGTGNGTHPGRHTVSAIASKPKSYNGKQFCPQTKAREVQDQQDEFMALASIYDEPDQFCVVEDTFGGRFCADVDVPQPFFVLVKRLGGLASCGTTKTINFEPIAVKYLPPITMHFNLPPDYPSTRPPRFRLSCRWLSKSQLSCLGRCLSDIWCEDRGQVVLFKWTVFLKEETLTRLNIRDTLDLSSMADASSFETATLLPEIVEYDELRREQAFRLQFFKCHVCFEERIGAKCMRFKGCEHTYCRDCMRSYFEVQIRDGNVKRLCCPSDRCPSLALPLQVRDLVDSELYAKYDRLLLSSTLDSMSDVTYCPRESCRCAVLLDNGSVLASCPSCHFAFCTFCMMAYHGIEPCRLKSDERLALFNKYTNGDETERRQLEARYGRRQLSRLVEATMSDTWLLENSKSCPKCKAQIEKVDGCNKMTCWKCNTYFCWLCMQRLDPVNPYRHYDGRGQGGCFGLLFHGTVEDAEVDDGDFGDGDFGDDFLDIEDDDDSDEF